MFSSATMTTGIIWVVLFASQFTVITSKACCPDEWISYKSHCYLIGHDKRTFMEAHFFCYLHNAYLVRVDDYLENNFLKRLLRKLKGSATWLGLSDQRSEGNWRWEGTNIHPKYTDWESGEPNNYRDEDCAAFWDSNNYKWNDFPCKNKYRPLCEKKRKITVTFI